jgi:glycosyltransferase involved in cell wall biosynthesis
MQSAGFPVARVLENFRAVPAPKLRSQRASGHFALPGRHDASRPLLSNSGHHTRYQLLFAIWPDAIPGGLAEWWIRKSAERADSIITVSEFSRGQICFRLGVPPARVSVVHNAPAVRPLPKPAIWPGLAQRLGVSSGYILAFADGSPHKNLARLFTAFALLNDERVQLLIVGRRDDQGRRVLALRDRLRLGDRVKFTGHLSDACLALVFANAALLVCPSLHEGFGLTVTEAMAAGLPVACSKAGALPEIAGEAAIFFDPLDVAQIAHVIDRLLANEPLRTDPAGAGRLRVAQFSWERAARKTVAVYERVGRRDAAVDAIASEPAAEIVGAAAEKG